MAFITVGKENNCKIKLYYEDRGAGQPILLVHGWPLSGRSWEKQISTLLEAGYRVITYDRRGFGQSSQPVEGYDYDTLADDLRVIISELKLRDVTLIGFSMGGGEVARYLGAYGSKGIRQAVFMSAITPFLLKTKDNAAGVPKKVFEDIQAGLAADRPAFLAGFFENFFNADAYRGKRISDEVLRLSWTVAAFASPIATTDCVDAWQTDFRKDLQGITIPTLIIHGDADRIVPFEASGKRMPALIKGSRLVVIKGGPHGLNWTHADEVNRELLAFIDQK
jgi:non-heme chloroperoxidase